MKKKKEFTPEEIELALNNAAASLAIEGLMVTEEARKLGRRMLKGEITREEVIKIILEKVKH